MIWRTILKNCSIEKLRNEPLDAIDLLDSMTIGTKFERSRPHPIPLLFLPKPKLAMKNTNPARTEKRGSLTLVFDHEKLPPSEFSDYYAPTLNRLRASARDRPRPLIDIMLEGKSISRIINGGKVIQSTAAELARKRKCLSLVKSDFTP